jgi:hypothetical protein
MGSSSEGNLSSQENSGPVLPTAPLINHTPITAKRLETLRMQLEGEGRGYKWEGVPIGREEGGQ